jgi:hypothetical protein
MLSVVLAKCPVGTALAPASEPLLQEWRPLGGTFWQRRKALAFNMLARFA